jgi:[acyl-carrier-protein] S-malonyltransferase
METMADLQVTGILELPPAGTLTGIARRALKGVETFALKTPDQLDDARTFVDKHGSPSEIDASPTWRLLVAPMKGTFTRTDQVRRESGDTVEAGEVVAKVKSLRDELEVKAPHGGIVVEWLVEEGDPVAPGQPLVRLHPNGGPQ